MKRVHIDLLILIQEIIVHVNFSVDVTIFWLFAFYWLGAKLLQST